MIGHWNAITSHKWRKDWYTSTGIVLTRWWLWWGGVSNSVLGLILSTFYSIFFFGVTSGVELSILKIKPKEIGGSLRLNFWKTWHVCIHREEKHPNGVETLTTLFTHKEQGVCQIVALPFTLKCILRQKKNDGNSNISPCKNILIFKKSSNQNPSRY
jgi:hypothetical protein